MIAELKQNIDLVSIVESAGIPLKSSGPRMVGICPFHDDKTPSFFVFPDNHFKCFGCQASGDVITFVQKLYGLTFPDALKYLGLEQGRVTPKVKKDIERRKLEKQKAETDKQFEINLQYTLAILVDATHKAVKEIKTIDNFEKYGDILQPLPWWEYNLELLNFGSSEDREAVCREFKNFEVLQAKRIWSDDFNYLEWLKEFNNKRNAEDEWKIDLHFAGSKGNRKEALNA